MKREVRISAATTVVILLCGCGGGSGNGGDASSGGIKSCDTDPLRTGLVAQQTGVSVDAFDCQILQWAAAYNEPDPMIFKAIIYVESRFDEKAVACPNLPCGTPSGWTTAESGCYGLMQVVPACSSLSKNVGFLANGHPNLTTDGSASGWANSFFNPDINIQIGIAGVAGNRAQVEQQFPGCSANQYTMMAIGNYNSYGSTKSCTVYNTDYDNAVLAAYHQYATAAGYPAQAY
jgi:Transglycosylase SLT domain